MRPPSGDEEVSSPISKPAKENKRKRASNFEGQNPKKRTACKPKGNTIPLTMESVQRLRKEEEEEEEEIEDDYGLVAHARASIEIRRTSKPVGVDTTPSRLDEVDEETSTQVPEPRGTEDALSRGKETVEEVVDTGELSRYEVKNRGLTKERDAFKLLSEQREGEAKGLRAELEAAQKEQADPAEQVNLIFEVNNTDSGVVANSSVPQVQQKLDMIGQLREKVDLVKAEAEAWKKNMDRLASEKKAAQAQLASAETQLRSLKEKALVQAKKIEEFQSRLGSATSDRERLPTELAVAKSEVETAKANVDAMVVVYRSDAEVAQVQEKESQRENLEEIHARGFNLTAKIENAKELEAEARVLAFPDDDDSGSMSGSESREGLEREDADLRKD
ncbi:uncharacterized protein [Nicotiana tomentosiformis]|uniref:uncharacterized protein n=1 Tax=Nicotiana tomentosiformis TaxID=4098 RepID=UPI00388C3DCE